MALIFGAIIMLIFGNASEGSDVSTSAAALTLATKELGTARVQDFDTLTSSSRSSGIYSIQTIVTTLDSVTKKVVSSVSWFSGRPLSLTLTTHITTTDSQNSCPLVGDWSHPKHFDFPTASLVPGSPNGFGIADVAIQNDKLYLAADTTIGNGPTFFIFDVPSDTSQVPTFRGSVDNAPTISSTGINAITLAGNYAFAANGTNSNFSTCSVGANCAQLQTISLSDPSHPGVVANTKVPSVTGSSGQAVGWSIVYKNGYLYLGLKKTSGGAEFNIFDVGANIGSPTSPVWLGGYSVGRTINSIRLSGTYAHLATDDSARELIVLDVSDKTHPILAGIFDAPGTNNFGLGYDLALTKNKLYFGRTYVANAPELYVLNITQPTTPGVLGSVDIGTPQSTDGVNALLARDPLVFALTNNALKIFDATNPTSIVSISSLPLLGSGTALACAGTTLYVAQSVGANQDVLSAITP